MSTVLAPAPRAPAPPPPPRPAAVPRPSRVDGIDLLRGLVIALMVLDHVRDYFHVSAFAFSPTDLARTTPALFWTRWVTHLCAPTFAFLAGASAYLQRSRALARGASRAGPARFLATRGAWLILLEVTVVGFAIDFTFPFLFLQIIWAIGAALLLLAPMQWLPPRAVLALGLGVVATHGAVSAATGGATALLTPGPIPGGMAGYPLLPWAAIVWAGYGFGGLFARPTDERRRAQLLLAGAALALFAVLRALNGFGDPAPWGVQPRGAAFTALSVLNVTKYPPSLQYVLLTLAVSLSGGVLLERWVEARGAAARVVGAALRAYGSTPLFTYLLHFYLVHTLALLAGAASGVPARAFVGMIQDPSGLQRAQWGVSLPAVYLVWLAVLALLYGPARWYARRKVAGGRWWYRYL
ncbi:heparan-alpha-glucosaminide N-acetyltransferase domain-containing protein [Roseisolibacter sp. H3M3-2]|uniref:DUF1624 domain-containing protein n=1 Tax=Roseisolibacter sp. H3M3-2 TaxID=3031323 RepID=UPI0023DA74FF|nr:heparan-alpha-glucosaminide N-acetyltransferase domain-containing protein [Roseisolibacter sp. H3M3-2]MDF1503743.1 heparan-alpha-glucosaminide N-acetyltransferase domain-containing protein [Roseisolibacter sp. H3M3-2]